MCIRDSRKGIAVPRKTQREPVAQNVNVKAAGGDQITKGDRVVKIYKGVDGEWPLTFSGTPDQSFDRAGEIFSRRSGHFHPLAPRLDIRVRLRISIGRRRLGGNAPAIPDVYKRQVLERLHELRLVVLEFIIVKSL